MAGLQVTFWWRWNSFRRQIRRQMRTCARRRQLCSRSSKTNRCRAEQRLRRLQGWLRRFMGAIPRCAQVAGRAVPGAPLKQSVADRILSRRDTEHRGTQARWNARTHARQTLERFSLEVISINRQSLIYSGECGEQQSSENKSTSNAPMPTTKKKPNPIAFTAPLKPRQRAQSARQQAQSARQRAQSAAKAAINVRAQSTLSPERLQHKQFWTSPSLPCALSGHLAEPARVWRVRAACCRAWLHDGSLCFLASTVL